MSPKVAFISQPRLSKLRLLNNARRKSQWLVGVEVHEYIAEQNTAKLLELDNRRDIDVIIAGGGNAAMIATMGLKTPMVKIQISGFDVIQALWQAQRLAKTAVFINYNEPIEQLERYASLFKINVEQHTFNGVTEAIDTVLSVIEQPDRIVIGASHVCDIAQSMHAQSVFIYSQDAVNQALEAAEQLALSLSAEREKREKLEAILRSVHDGIIYIDANLKVEELNPAAESILNLNACESINKPISEVIPNSGLENVIVSEKSQYNQLLNVGNTQILSNRVAVFNQGKLIGAVASFQDVRSVRKAELSLQASTKSKNLVAKNPLTNILGANPEVKKLVDKAGHFAKTEATILIQGATGTGKELLAQGIHLASSRALRPFVVINCASIAEQLLESTLFGYDEGAFTGANKKGKAGLFELAHKGSIFLDEIGELPLALQGRLLRVIQEKEVMRLGSDSILAVDIRIIAATNRNLKKMVDDHQFKEDLFYRLNVLNLNVPSLNTRYDDIPLFIHHFFKIKNIDPAVYSDLIFRSCDLFLNHHWPGNIRELENIIERLAVMFKAQMSMVDIEQELKSSLEKEPSVSTENIRLSTDNYLNDSPNQLQPQSVASQQQQIKQTLIRCNNNKSLAAHQLGISRSTLWRKMKDM